MFSGTLVTVVNMAVMAAGYPIYLHFLGYERYGIWLILATVLSFAQLGNLGVDHAVMKLVAEEYGRNNPKTVQQYVTSAIAILVFSGVVILSFIIAYRIKIVALFNLSEENAKTVLWLLPYVGCLSVYVLVVQTLNATLSGLGRMDLANYIQSAGRIVAVATAGSLSYRGHGIESLLIGNLFSYAFIHITSLILIWRISHIRLLRISNLDVQRSKHLLRFGSGVFGGSLISMLFSPFNKLILSRYAGVSTIPIYEITFNTSMQVRGLIESGLRPLMPEVSRLNGMTTQQARRRIIQIYRSAMKLIFFAGVPIYAILVLTAPMLLEVWLGDRFVETLPGVLRIMLAGTFLSLICVPAYYTLMGMGRVRYCFASQVIQGVLNASIVGTIIFFERTISVRAIAFTVAIAMGLTSAYVLFQKRRAIKTITC